MLERATACINAGARQSESLRCVPRAIRSRRNLHSTFWSNSATTFDLPPYALPVPSSQISQADSIKCRRTRPARPSHQSSTCSVPEGGVFLDFLYPPQALAYLNRANAYAKSYGSQWEPWERRNARRLPEGFIQASRGYASQSVPSEEAATIERERDAFDDIDDGFWKAERKKLKKLRRRKKSGKGSESREGDESKMGIRDERVDEITGATYHTEQQADREKDRSILEEETSGSLKGVHVGTMEEIDDIRVLDVENDEDKPEPSGPAAPTIGPVGVEVVADPASPRRALQELMARGRRVDTDGIDSPRLRRSADVSLIKRAMGLYRALPGDALENLPIIIHFLHWLAEREIQVADDNFLSIFHSLKPERKNVRVYQAAITVYLRRQKPLTRLHKEMLSTCSDTPELFYPLFRDRVRAKDWHSAFHYRNQFFGMLEDKKQMRESSEVTADNAADRPEEPFFDEADYWNDALSLPGILGSIPSIIEWAQKNPAGRKAVSQVPDDTPGETAMSPYAFASTFCRNVINQTISLMQKPGEVRNQPRNNAILQGLVFILDGGAHNFKIVGTMISRLAQCCKKLHVRWANELITDIYLIYRKIPGARPSPRTLHNVLEWAARLELRSARLEDLQVSIDMIVHDWENHYEVLSKEAVSFLSKHYAQRGDPAQVEDYVKYNTLDGSCELGENSNLWSLIYVHAQHGHVSKSIEAFEAAQRTLAKNGALPDLECWTALLEAYRRSDDLEGGVKVLEDMLNQSHFKTDERAFQKIANLLAQRGDVEGVRELIDQFERVTGQTRTTRLVSELMAALIQSDELDAALELLSDSVRLHRKGSLKGEQARLFNLMLSAYAFARDQQQMMRVFQLMKAEQIRIDDRSYLALLQGLAFHRHTSTAFAILRTKMIGDGIRPHAVHFAVIMAGFMNQNLYKEALWAHAVMQQMNVRENRGTRSLYLQNKARLERAMLHDFGKAEREPNSRAAFNVQRYDFDEIEDSALISIEELSEQLLDNQDPDDDYKLRIDRNDQKDFGHNASEYFAHLAFIYGSHRCVEALQELFAHRRLKGANAPLDVLTGLMQSLEREQLFDDVESCWKIAKEEADHATKLSPLPTLGTNRASESATEISETDGLNDMNASLDFMSPVITEHHAELRAPGRRHILSQPFYYYLRALEAQDRISDAISVATSLLHEGYVLDNVTWNRLIESLCKQSPPLVSLAFTLTERFLIPGWPGWKTTALSRPAVPMDKKVGLERIKARYLRSNVLIPTYRTLVRLAASFLDLRHIEASGRRVASAMGDRNPQLLNPFVGSMKQIRRQAPKTLFVVQSMPKVDDYLQRTLIRREFDYE